MAVKSLARSSLRQSGKVNSALAGYESNYFHHLETVRLGGSAASVTFSNLARYNDYQHFQLRVIARNTGEDGNVLLRFNADTGSNYTRHALYGDGSGVFSNAGANQSAIQIGSTTLNSNTANSFGAGIYDILDPFETSKNKTVRSLTGQTPNNQILLRSGVWLNTAAVSSITLLTNANNFSAGSRFSLYGLKARA